MRTSLELEMQEMSRWQLLPGRDNFRDLFSRFVAHEFMAPEEQRRFSGALLAAVVRHAAAHVPYYRQLLADLGLTADDIRDASDLQRLPVLKKSELLLSGNRMLAAQLPPGERTHGWVSSSGTTGKPVLVMHTASSKLLFSILAVRQYRWYRFAPMERLASIRLSSQNPALPDGSLLPNGQTLRQLRWRYGGNFFHTGPQLHFNVENPVEDQLAWLIEHQPHYLLSYSETLEHLVFACNGDWPGRSLRKLLAIAEQLTPSMRERIEGTTGVPIEQGYGLNEIGLVAVRCSAGRYHWHIEHCIVEILDEEGKPCAEGEAGHVVVTALRNYAMPLFRYDTGDIAVACTDACPCGRTLPAFGEIVGRYSRIAYLPEGTLPKVGTLRSALESVPAELAANLRQFQVHQYQNGRFELRLVTAGSMSEAFGRFILEKWQSSFEGDPAPLDIVFVDNIERAPGGKFQDFTSDFMPPRDG